MLARMDLAAASAGPWLVLGVVLGLVLAGGTALAVGVAWRTARPSPAPAAPSPEEPKGWIEDDLPGFLERPPGLPGGEERPAPVSALDPPLAPPDAEPSRRRRVPAHAGTTATPPAPGRVLLVLASVSVLLIGVAAALGLTGADGPATPAATGRSPERNAPPTWEAPDLTAVPEQPGADDPGAGRLATASVPIGEDGALVRLTFEGLVLERRAVGTTVAYPGVSMTAAEVPGGPALAHVVLRLWNCLADTAPEDPQEAGCRRLPTEYADLPTPALTVEDDGGGLRISGRFPTYVRPSGSAPEWTGRVYPLAVHVRPDGDGATGTLHLGLERAPAIGDPLLSELRRGG